MTLPEKIGAGQPIDQDWKTIDSIIDVLAAMKQCTSSHPQYIQVTLNDGGFVFDFSGLVTAIRAAGINL
jgi:hypothetical protein